MHTYESGALLNGREDDKIEERIFRLPIETADRGNARWHLVGCCPIVATLARRLHRCVMATKINNRRPRISTLSRITTS